MIGENRLTHKVADALIWAVVGGLALACFLPFVHVVSQSLSDALSTRLNLVSLWPVNLTLDNYSYLMGDKIFASALGISILRVIVGVTLNLLVALLTAYPLSLDFVYMPGRQAYKMVLIFSMLFGGGLIAFYLAIKSLGLLNRFLVLVIPGTFSIFYTILIINYFRGLPRELYESAAMDGANHFDILFRIYVPLSKPSLATVGLFSAVGHWNSWFDGIVFLQKTEQWPLQSYLYTIVSQRGLAARMGAIANYDPTVVQRFLNASPEGVTTAMIVIAIVPIVLVYPAVQRYFVTGLTLGAVKG